MDYKKIAAAGMSAALMLSIGGSALAKGPGSLPPEKESTAVSQADSSESRHREKPIRKPEQKPETGTDSSQSSETTEKKSEKRARKGKKSA